MPSAFGTAFAAARKAGKKTFMHNGKSYNTKVAADTPKKGPVPKSRQGQDSGSGGRATKKPGITPAEARKMVDKLNQKYAMPQKPKNDPKAATNKANAATRKKVEQANAWKNKKK